ncbi:unnamed protein product [Rotaria magnacalcarata]
MGGASIMGRGLLVHYLFLVWLVQWLIIKLYNGAIWSSTHDNECLFTLIFYYDSWNGWHLIIYQRLCTYNLQFSIIMFFCI